MTAFFLALTAACNAFVAWVQLHKDNKLESLQDEIDTLAADGSPASKLRMERIAQRIKRASE